MRILTSKDMIKCASTCHVIYSARSPLTSYPQNAQRIFSYACCLLRGALVGNTFEPRIIYFIQSVEPRFLIPMTRILR